VVQALLKAGAEVGAGAEGGGVTSALHQCAVHGHDDCLAALLDHPSSSAVDVNLLDKEGSTPLHKVPLPPPAPPPGGQAGSNSAIAGCWAVGGGRRRTSGMPSV
jgi:hypothetical protein